MENFFINAKKRKYEKTFCRHIIKEKNERKKEKELAFYIDNRKNEKRTVKEQKKLDEVLEKIKNKFKNAQERNANSTIKPKRTRPVTSFEIAIKLCSPFIMIALLLAFMGFYCFAVLSVHYYTHLNFELINLPNARVIVEMSTTGEFGENDETVQKIFDNSYGDVLVGEIESTVENGVLKLKVPTTENIQQGDLGYTIYLRFYNCMLRDYVDEAEFSRGPALSATLSAYNSSKTVENIKYYDVDSETLHYNTLSMPVMITGNETPLQLEFGLDNYDYNLNEVTDSTEGELKFGNETAQISGSTFYIDDIKGFRSLVALVNGVDTSNTSITLKDSNDVNVSISVPEYNGFDNSGRFLQSFSGATIIQNGEIDYNPGISFEMNLETGEPIISGINSYVKDQVDIYNGSLTENKILLKDVQTQEVLQQTQIDWIPIGIHINNSDSRCFRGNFNGQENLISGLYANLTKNRVGLFGFAGGSYNNITLNNSYFKGVSMVGGIVSSNASHNYKATNCQSSANVCATGSQAGGIFGSRGSAINCTNTGKIFAHGDYVGGIAGLSEGYIEDCTNSGEIISSSDYVGGIVGHMGFYSDNPLYVKNCTNNGDVSGDDYVGGIVGFNNESTIELCINNGSVVGTSSVGGIVGENTVDVKRLVDCSNSGGVLGTSFVGGVAGRNYSMSYYIGKNCSNTGEITGTNEEIKTVGEIVGQDKGYQQFSENGQNFVFFGEWPQTIKANEVVVNETVSDDRGYFLGSDGEWYAKRKANPYAGDQHKFFNGNPIVKNTDYYFKVEPIKWRILENKDGTLFMLTDKILDAVTYQLNAHGDGAPSQNNYKESNLRAWLNGLSNGYGTGANNWEGSGFLNYAFNSFAKENLIQTTEVDNSAESTGYDPNDYACENTSDEVFLLSYAELTNLSYGFPNNASRQKTGTDYALANYLYINPDYIPFSAWWSRSPHDTYANLARDVISDGYINNDLVNITDRGAAPALKIKIS